MSESDEARCETQAITPSLTAWNQAGADRQLPSGAGRPIIPRHRCCAVTVMKRGAGLPATRETIPPLMKRGANQEGKEPTDRCDRARAHHA